MTTRILFRLLLIFTLLVPMTSCNRHGRAIEAMVEELNSPIFRAKEAKTGLFDDSKAEIKGNQLIISFLCRPFINLAQIQHEDLSELEESAVEEFRANLVNDKFKEGMEALSHEKMTILLVWQDVNGFSIKIPIDPEKVLLT
ncbi:MAG: hypothetical protein HDS68_07915 [Bacteroidales bacterium]|nr:hypothetical protein [Bacteroidales bacterium]